VERQAVPSITATMDQRQAESTANFIASTLEAQRTGAGGA
jgi:Tfp pilus assembly protein FimT